MTLHCIAIDDEPLALDLIRNFCNRHEGLVLEASFTNPEEAGVWLKQHTPDLIFLDVQMPDISGLEFFSEHGRRSLVIFTTAFSEYAIRGFDLNAVDYLLKPFDYTRFTQAVEKAARQLLARRGEEGRENQSIFVKSEYRILNLAVNRILYLESRDDYVKIHLADGKFVMSKITTKAMQEKLPADRFVRIHRSFIVNKAYVSQIAATSVRLGGVELPIGKNYKKEVQERLIQ
jgi:two-component system LytT family response regulator